MYSIFACLLNGKALSLFSAIFMTSTMMGTPAQTEPSFHFHLPAFRFLCACFCVFFTHIHTHTLDRWGCAIMTYSHTSAGPSNIPFPLGNWIWVRILVRIYVFTHCSILHFHFHTFFRRGNCSKKPKCTFVAVLLFVLFVAVYFLRRCGFHNSASGAPC